MTNEDISYIDKVYGANLSPLFRKGLLDKLKKIQESMKPYLLRETDGDTFLIPFDKAKEFDLLVGEIEDEENDESTHLLNGEFDTLYAHYKVEGNLYSTPFFLAKHPNEKELK